MGYSMMMDELQHQAVEKVLQDYLKGDDLDSAVNLWDRQYSKQSMDKLAFFVFEIATNSTLRSLRKQILLDLESKLTSDEASLEVIVHSEKVAEPLSVKEEVLNSESPENKAEIILEQLAVIDSQALASCLNRLLSGLKHIDVEDLVEVLNEQFEEHQQLPTFIKDEIVLILTSGHQPHYLVYDEENIRHALNIFYSVLCEYIGPVKADAVLLQAIQQTAKEYPAENMIRFL